MLRDLQKGARKSQASAFAEGTYDNLITHWVTFLEFCIFFRFNALPAAVQTLIWYAQYLQDNVLKSHQSLQCYLSGVRKLHEILGFKIKNFKDAILRLTLRGMKRANTFISKQARPMTITLLERIHDKLDHDNFEDALFWAACVVAFFLLFRKSNLVPDTRFGFNPLKQLRRDDLLYTGSNILVGIRWAKNHQFSRELLTFPLPILHGLKICPLKALNNVYRMHPCAGHHHLFCRPDGSSLTYPQFQRKLHLVLAAIGERAEEYSSHSFRRGGASFAFLCGIPAELIKVLGNWKSDCYMKYLHFPLESRIAASDLMRIRIINMNLYKSL